MEFVKYGEGIPSVVRDDLRNYLEWNGIPRNVLTIFRAADSLRIALGAGVEYHINGLVVGFSREDEEICVDLDNGRVFLLADWSPTSPLQVNRDIYSFVESLVALQGMLPLYGRDRDLDESATAEVRVRAQLERIDPISIEDPNSFWSAFLDDVAVGDYPGQGLSRTTVVTRVRVR
ncbi:SUKH-4 family immunity protein [Streptomyces hokutonensis]|uniref:SUKH-4 family immunity protein n=1 Tax=Streptomyces hokutonensis TaxID=1306990 RepID=UPI00382A4BBD